MPTARPLEEERSPPGVMVDEKRDCMDYWDIIESESIPLEVDEAGSSSLL